MAYVLLEHGEAPTRTGPHEDPEMRARLRDNGTVRGDRLCALGPRRQ